MDFFFKTAFFYFGKVVAFDGDEKKGILKVRIYPFLADVSEQDLPSVYPFLDYNNYEIKDLPRVGDIVWCFFNGDTDKIFWVRSIQKKESDEIEFLEEKVKSLIEDYNNYKDSDDLDLSSITYGKYSVRRYSDMYEVFNSEEGEYLFIDEDKKIKVSYSVKNKSICFYTDNFLFSGVNMNLNVSNLKVKNDDYLILANAYDCLVNSFNSFINIFNSHTHSASCGGSFVVPATSVPSALGSTFEKPSPYKTSGL